MCAAVIDNSRSASWISAMRTRMDIAIRAPSPSSPSTRARSDGVSSSAMAPDWSQPEPRATSRIGRPRHSSLPRTLQSCETCGGPHFERLPQTDGTRRRHGGTVLHEFAVHLHEGSQGEQQPGLVPGQQAPLRAAPEGSGHPLHHRLRCPPQEDQRALPLRSTPGGRIHVQDLPRRTLREGQEPLQNVRGDPVPARSRKGRTRPRLLSPYRRGRVVRRSRHVAARLSEPEADSGSHGRGSQGVEAGRGRQALPGRVRARG